MASVAPILTPASPQAGRAGAARARTPFQRVPILFGIGTLLAVFVVLELLLRFEFVNPYIVPLPSDVVLALGRIVVEENALGRTGETVYEVVLAAILAVAIGLSFGVLLYLSRPLRRALEAWVASLAAAPLVLAFPLFLVIFGRSSSTVIVMSTITGLAPMILKTSEGLAGVRPVLVDVGRSLKMTRAQIFKKILLPAAMPVIFTGIRLSWTFVLISVVGVEFLINLGGLGQLINELAERYDMPGTYAAIAFAIGVSVAFFISLERIEQWLQPRP